MVSRWASVRDGVVDNVSLWDGNPDTWTPPADSLMVELADDQNVGPGDLYNGTTFTHVDPAPAPTTVPVDVDPTLMAALLDQAAKATTVAATRNVLTALLQQLQG